MLLVSILAAALQAAPPSPGDPLVIRVPGPPAPVVIADPESHVVAQLKERASAYPDMQVVDLTRKPGGAVICGRVTSSEGPPLIFRAIRGRDGHWSIGGPFLVRPGSWNLPGNRRLSDIHARSCESFGVAPAAS
ncbi:MAG: hypothetical protein IR159_01865 [Brevundimonas sp.]|nr:hypothetical protein [Brevundimonas sp.]